MRVQAHQSSDRSARAALPAASSVAVSASPSASSSPFPRQPGSAFYSDSAPLPKPRSRTSVLVSKGGSFLFVDEKPTSLPQTAAPPTNPRDSITSTGSEPFYLDINVPIPTPKPRPEPAPIPLQIAPIGGASTTSETTADQRNDLRQQQPWPPPRKESLSGNNPTPWFDKTKTNMENINIAVIGAIGVGKSSFVQRILRSPRPPNHNVTAFRQEFDGALHIVTLVELDLEVFEVNPNQPIQWPKQVAGHMEPRMDGALMLYDVTNKESIRDLKSTLSALSISGLPTVLVATKWDAPEQLRQIDPAALAASFPNCAAHYQLSPNSPGSTRECLQTMVRAAMTARRGTLDKAEGSAQRRRAASTANLDAPPDNHSSRPLSQHSKHSRASSDLSLLRGFPPPPPPEGGYYRPQAARSPRLDYQTPTPYSVPTLDVPSDGSSQTVSSMLRTPGIRLDGGAESFLDIDESDAESYRYSEDIPILQRDPLGDDSSKFTGVTFGELVDRLLAAKMTRTDNNFNDIFLCLYRKFAAPYELLSGIMLRFTSVREDRTMQFLVRTEVQMRIIEVIAKWVSTYPGDFARPQSKKKLQDLVKLLSTDPVFSTAAHQMRLYMTRVVEDDDTNWAKSDSWDEDVHAFDYKANTDAGRRQSEFAESMSSIQLTPEEAAGMAHPGRPSQSSEFSGSDVHSRVPARFQFHQYEDYEREAATLVPGATVPMDKMRYHIFMEIDPDTLAEEITRIDWIMFSSIKIRDLVRHVTLPTEQKERCRSLKNVNRMVSHFNHIAKWVTQMVLIRDKAKHRAPCLEKFMVIAHRLRQLNNYNGLAAVLAGINDTAIHRLAQTRALVSADVQKRFARLGLLMGTQKSHFAYRLAWENSPVPRIPFIPLHRRDLVTAEEGSRTFIGNNSDRINWKKFEILGEVLLPIMKSQGQPYPNLQRHDMSRELVLDCKMSADDEQVYQRSLQVEPSSGAGSESKKKFPWLPK